MELEKPTFNLEAAEERLLNYLVDQHIAEIVPVTYYNDIVYDILQNYEVKEKKQLDALLDSLTEKGYFDKKEYDRVMHCPRCKSIHKITKYNCPQCQSVRVKRHELIEHTNCGYIGEITDFLKPNDEMVCPKCGKDVKHIEGNGDYEVIGTSYECDNCGYKFDKPDTTNYCQNCGKIYDYKNSQYQLVYTYSLTDKITELTPIREVRDVLRSVESILLEKEYEVELEGMFEGKSGEMRPFDLIATRGKDKLVLDISSWGKEQDLMNLLGKKMDIDPRSTILVDITGSEKMIQLADIYKIKVFNAQDPLMAQSFREYIDVLNAPKKETKSFWSSITKLSQAEQPESDENDE
jgi:transposase-like protein